MIIDRSIFRSFSIVALLLLFLLPGKGMAQGNALIKARNLMEQGELLKAKPQIDQAVTEEESAAKARTWFYRGKIHYDLFRSNDEEHQELVSEKGVEIPLIAASSYLEALERDKKGRYKKDIEKEMPVLKNALLNYGVKAFNQREHEQAYEAFRTAIEAGEWMSGGPVDTLAYFNAGLAARQIGKNEEALEFLSTSAELGNEEGKSWFIISRIHKENGDMEKAFKAVQKGRKAEPGMKKLVLEELNHFIRREDFKMARESLEEAVEGNPENGPLHFSLGTVYDHLYQASGPKDTVMVGGKDSSFFKKAAKSYRKAIDIDSGFHSAYYSLGALYYNRGADVLNAADRIKDQVKYEDEIKKAEKDLEKARPLLEKALEIKPNDRQTLIALRNLYARLGKEEKAEELQERLDN